MNKVIVHPGIFHADDVMSIAILMAWKNLGYLGWVERRYPSENELHDENVFVLDVGRDFDPSRLNFDHHQIDCPIMSNGKKHAACTMLWDFIANDVISKRADDTDVEFVKEEVARLLLRPIAVIDNGQKEIDPEVCSLSYIISSYNLNWDEERSVKAEADAFEDAVLFAVKTLLRAIKSAISNDKARSIVNNASTCVEGTCLDLEKFAPWQDAITDRSDEAELLRVVFPSDRGGWNVQVVPVNPTSFTAKKPLHKEWLAVKPVGCTFVHAGLFIAAFETKEAAINAMASELSN